MKDTRALAAAALAEVALRGASLREVMQRRAPQLADARDRALLSALLNEGTRWWLRFDAAVEGLLQQSIRSKEPAVHALLVLGLVQLEILQLPDYAAVAATVQAVRGLHRPRHAGLVNAILRRWQREREQHLARLDARAETRLAYPAWLLQAFGHDWPAAAERIATAGNGEPPLMLRVNRRRTTREDLRQQLQAAGYDASLHPWLTDALTLPHSTDVTRMPGFADGFFAVQDGAAQIAADLLDAREGMRVLDACAAPGGKTCHALERQQLDMTALEFDPGRARRIDENLQRLQLRARVVVGDAAEPALWWDGQPYDRILIDAPCSATGVIRRRPDVRLHRRSTDIAALQVQQTRILEALWPLLAPGGRLVYATCSLLRAENQAIVEPFLARQADAHPVAIELPAGEIAGPGWQLLPGDGDLDGMYYAVLEKSA
ncbi:16S rRNA (cytosine(967)-C(5))-methyltransferase RsmB [Frateuria aurantia]